MSTLREEIIPYLDSNQNVATSRHNGQGRSDNGIMYTSEYYIMLKRNGLLTDADRAAYATQLARHFTRPGLLARAPGDRGQEAPDDYHGVLAACAELNLPGPSRDILIYGLKHLFFYNNVNPGKFTLPDGKLDKDTFLGRMPQLIAMMTVQFPFLLRLLFLPTYVYAALVILYAGLRNIPNTKDMDARRLTWLLVIATEKVSILCRLAARVWRRKLAKDFPGTGMKGVAAIYYQDNHPFQRYWVD